MSFMFSSDGTLISATAAPHCGDKYLGNVFDNELNFNINAIFTRNKYQPRVFCFQKLKSLNVNAAVLHTVYQSGIESALTLSFLGWFGELSVRSKNVVNKVVNVCRKVVGRNKRPKANCMNVVEHERLQ